MKQQNMDSLYTFSNNSVTRNEVEYLHLITWPWVDLVLIRAVSIRG